MLHSHFKRAFIILLSAWNVGAASTECHAQTGYPNFGFRSYSGPSRGSYSNGMGGYSSNNSFGSGFSGLSRTPSGMAYSTQNSTQAAAALAQSVSAVWSKMPVGQVMRQSQQSTFRAEQPMSRPTPGGYGLLPQTSRREMVRCFLEGGSPQSAGAQAAATGGPSPDATNTAYRNYQTAENESTKAYNAAQRVRYYDTDTWSRKNDASQAEYAASNANYAAQRAEAAASNGDSQARNYAGLAREAANRARGNANQARYNADTMH